MKTFSIGSFPPPKDKVVIYQMPMGGGKEKKAKGKRLRKIEHTR